MDFDFGLECTPKAMQLIADHVIKPCIHLKTISISSLKRIVEGRIKVYTRCSGKDLMSW